MTDIAQVNRILDRTCRKAGLDPMEVRLAMIQTLQDKLANGKGFNKLPPTEAFKMAPGETVAGLGTMPRDKG